MNDLTNAINRTAADFTEGEEPEETTLPFDGGILHTAGKKWAAASLDTFTGELLDKALGISRAISEFTNELKKGT